MPAHFGGDYVRNGTMRFTQPPRLRSPAQCVVFFRWKRWI